MGSKWKLKRVFFFFHIILYKKGYGGLWSARKSRLVSLRNVGALPSAHVLSIRRAPSLPPSDPRLSSSSSFPPSTRIPVPLPRKPWTPGISGNRPMPPPLPVKPHTTFGFFRSEKNVPYFFYRLLIRRTVPHLFDIILLLPYDD